MSIFFKDCQKSVTVSENQAFNALVASCLLQLVVVGKLNLPTTARKAVAMVVSPVA